jgi:hypothetical protein
MPLAILTLFVLPALYPVIAGPRPSSVPLGKAEPS